MLVSYELSQQPENKATPRITSAITLLILRLALFKVRFIKPPLAPSFIWLARLWQSNSGQALFTNCLSR